MSCNSASNRARSAHFFLLTLALPLAHASAATFRVGAGCTYSTIAAAVADAVANGTASDLILVRSGASQTISSMITIDHAVAGTVEIVGGYANCTDELPQPGVRTTVQVPSSGAFTVQNGGGTNRLFTLAQLAVIAGAGGGRLVDASGRIQITIDDSLLSNGQATDGANIRMAGPNLTLFIDGGASIYSGDATGDGGGIHCSGGGTVLLVDGAVSANSADGDGGGIYLDDCLLNSFAGGGVVGCPSGGNRGIVCNLAGAVGTSGRGGGIFATNGAEVNLIGGSATPATLIENVADYGGGLFLDGAATAAEIEDAEVADNSGFRGGGGIAVDNGAQLLLRATIPGCARGTRCSLVAGNVTGSISGETSPGAGIWVSGGGDATVRRTTFEGNAAGSAAGAAVAVEGPGSTALLEGNVLFDNSGVTLYAFDGGTVTGGFLSFWGNSVGSGGAIRASGAGSFAHLFSSLTLDSLTFGPAAAGATYFADCIVTQSLTNFPAPPDPGSFETGVSAATALVDPSNGNPHLRPDSPAIDYCDTFRYTPVDLDIDGEARGTDEPGVPTVPFGPFDLGADEWGPLFIGDFETGNCSAWSSDTGGC